jgi:hypothetical protein
MDKDIIEEKLTPHIKNIYRCIVDGFDKAVPLLKSESRTFCNRTKSGIIRDFIVSEVREVFSYPHIIENKSLVVLNIEGVIIRFKKLNRRLLAGNNPTNQSEKFSNQDKLPGFALPTVNLNAGYVIDESGYDIRSVHLTRPKSQYENYWVLNMESFIMNNMIIPEPKIMEVINSQDGPKVTVKESIKQKINKKKVSNE